MTSDELRAELARRRKAGWAIPAYNTNHLVEQLKASGGILAGNHWLLPDQQSFDEMKLSIVMTGSQRESKVCPACGERKPITAFKCDDSPSGRGRICEACSGTKSTLPEGERTGVKWQEVFTRKFTAGEQYPVFNRFAYDEMSTWKSFPGSMAMANALLWWETVDRPESPERLTKANYFPLDVLHKIVEGTGCTWGTHVRVMKKIINRVFSKHWQNSPGVGYRISTALAHDGLEASKLHDLVTTFSGAIHRRMQEAWELFPDAPEDTQEIMRKLNMVSSAQVQNLASWSDVFHKVFHYLKERVGGGDRQTLRPPDEVMSEDMDEVFNEAAKWFISWGGSLGYKINLRKEASK